MFDALKGLDLSAFKRKYGQVPAAASAEQHEASGYGPAGVAAPSLGMPAGEESDRHGPPAAPPGSASLQDRPFSTPGLAAATGLQSEGSEAAPASARAGSLGSSLEFWLTGSAAQQRAPVVRRARAQRRHAPGERSLSRLATAPAQDGHPLELLPDDATDVPAGAADDTLAARQAGYTARTAAKKQFLAMPGKIVEKDPLVNAISVHLSPSGQLSVECRWARCLLELA